MDSIILDRLKIFGGFNNDTPKIVILEVASCHGIDFKIEKIPNFFYELKKQIEAVLPVKISYPIHEWNCVARYINPQFIWKKGVLQIAYNNLAKMSETKIQDITHLDIERIGYPSPNEPENISPCIAYKWCKESGIKLTFECDLIEIKEKLALYLEDEIYVLAIFRSKLAEKLNKTAMINIIYSEAFLKKPNDLSNSSKVTYIKLVDFNETINDPNQLRRNLNPKIKSGAVALAATNYFWDISATEDPILEYNYLSLTEERTILDKKLKPFIKLAPQYFDLNYTFNSLFPRSYYNIERLASYYGFSKLEIKTTDAYELLQIAHVSETFYKGIYPNYSGDCTLIDYIPFSELDMEKTYSFGIINEKLFVFSEEELIRHFTHHKNFVSPANYNISISINAIKKLCNMTKNSQLIEIIKEIENMSNLDKEVAEFIKKFDNGCHNLLKSFLNLTMYMRGWKGKGKFPLTSKQALSSKERENEIEINVTKAFLEFYNEVENCHIGSLFLTLPLYQYCDQQYFKSKNESEGLTIKDRLDLVKLGNKTGNMGSCIRLSSNWLAATAHKYYTLLKLPAPFDIFKLRKLDE